MIMNQDALVETETAQKFNIEIEKLLSDEGDD